VVSDDANESFWERHALLAGLAASVIAVMLTVAVINEVLERRSRQRWSMLAQYVMLELVRNARMIWSGILEVASLLPAEPSQQTWLAIGTGIVRDTPRLAAFLRAIAGDAEGRRRLHDEPSFLAVHADDVLGEWAAVMLNADMYAEVIDRHVELAGDVTWVVGLLDSTYPRDDRRRQRVRSNPTLQIEGDPGGERLARHRCGRHRSRNALQVREPVILRMGTSLLAGQLTGFGSIAATLAVTHATRGRSSAAASRPLLVRL
jgi:hypothetical protein